MEYFEKLVDLTIKLHSVNPALAGVAWGAALGWFFSFKSFKFATSSLEQARQMLVEQNKLLLKQCAQLQDRIDEMHRLG